MSSFVFHVNKGFSNEGLLKAFGGMISPSTAEKVLGTRDLKTEAVKQRAAELANSWFNFRKGVDVGIGQHTIRDLLPQTDFGRGIHKSLVAIVALAKCVEEAALESGVFFDGVNTLVEDLTDVIQQGDANNEKKLPSRIDALMNHEGYFERVPLKASIGVKSLEGKLAYSDAEHLSVMVPKTEIKKVFEGTLEEVQKHLTDEGKERYALPSHLKEYAPIVVAYADELSPEMKDEVKPLLEKTFALEVTSAYGVPVRGDIQSTWVVAALLEPKPMDDLRETMGLNAKYSEGRPHRLTFGILPTPSPEGEDPSDTRNLLQRIEEVASLEGLSEALKNLASSKSEEVKGSASRSF